MTPKTEMEWSDSNLIYKGVLLLEDNRWPVNSYSITKYVYSGSDLIQILGPVVGTWNDRGALFS